MPTLRRTSEFRSTQGTLFKIHIDDTEWINVDAAFKVGGDGFILDYPVQARTSPRESYIFPSQLGFTFINELAGDDLFEQNLVSANEERFKIKIEKEGNLFWTGFVLTDNVTRNDEPKPSGLNISAVDGLGRLKTIDYSNNGIAYTGRATLLDHIFNCFSKIPFGYFYGDTDEFLKVSVNWYEDQHNYANTLDPLGVTDFDHLVFNKKDGNGNTTFWNCYDVLQECLKIFGARLYQSDGVWRLEQINFRKDATFTEFVYDKNGNQLSVNTTASYELDIQTTANHLWPRRLAGGQFAWYPPLDQVCIIYNHDSADNLLTGLTYNYIPGVVLNSEEVTVGNLDVQDQDESILLSGSINFSNLWEPEYNVVFYRHTWNILLKVGIYYLKREIYQPSPTTFAYGPVEWTTEPSFYQVSTPFISQILPPNTQQEYTGNVPFSVTAPTLPAGGDITFDITWLNCSGENGEVFSSSLSNGLFTLAYDTIDLRMNLLHNGEQLDMELSRKYCATNTEVDKNTSQIEMTTVIGDGPFPVTFNKLKVYDGTEWQISNNWRVNNVGDPLTIQELLITQILAGQKAPIKRYQGSIRGQMYAHTRLEWDEEYYLFEGGQFVANFDQWTGRWFLVTVDDTGIDTDETPDPQDDPIDPVVVGVEVPPGVTGENPVGTTGVEVQAEDILVGPMSGGFVEQIDVIEPLETLYQIGDEIDVVNPTTGTTDTLTVTEDTQIGDTAISVEGYLSTDYPAGTVIIPSAGDTIPAAQLSSEIVSEFFESSTIAKPDFNLKTDILLPEVHTLFLSSRNADLDPGVFDNFFIASSEYNDSNLTAIRLSFSTAGTAGSTIIDINKNGTTIHTAVISSGSASYTHTFDPAEVLVEGDEISFDADTISSIPPNGLLAHLKIERTTEIYMKKIKYQLNRIVQQGLRAHFNCGYLPSLQIGSGSAIFSDDSYINCGDDATLDITGDLTIMAWVKFNDFSTVDTIAGKYASATGYHIICLGSTIAFQVNSQTTCSFSTTGMETGTWYHIAATLVDDQALIYLNGEFKTKVTYSNAPTSITERFFIGANDEGPGANFFTGSMSMVRLYNISLTQELIQSVMNKPFTQLKSDEKTGIVSSWELSDITATTAPDSNNLNEGTIV